MTIHSLSNLFFGGFIIFDVLFSILRVDPTSSVGIVMFLFMLLFIGWSIANKVRVEKAQLFLLLGSTLWAGTHYSIGVAKPMSIALSFASILFFVIVQNSRINGKLIAKGLLTFWVLSILLNFGRFISGFSGEEVSEYFSGFFGNSNTFALYTCITLGSVLLLMDHQKIKWFTIALFLVSLFSHHSRNALLYGVVFAGFFFLYRQGKGKWVLPLFGFVIGLSLFFLLVIEPNMDALNITVLGKKAGTAGRSAQVLYVISSFDLTLWGNGAELIGRSVVEENGYAIHNAWVNTAYSMGVFYLLLYAYFLQTFYRLLSHLGKACLLAMHIYFFFEPGVFFSILMGQSLTIIVLLLSIQHENRARHL